MHRHVKHSFSDLLEIYHFSKCLLEITAGTWSSAAAVSVVTTRPVLSFCFLFRLPQPAELGACRFIHKLVQSIQLGGRDRTRRVPCGGRVLRWSTYHLPVRSFCAVSSMTCESSAKPKLLQESVLGRALRRWSAIAPIVHCLTAPNTALLRAD